MKIVVTGATGLIGRRLVETLAAHHELAPLGRREWDVAAGPPPFEALSGAGAIVHLAGEPVNQRWTQEAKRRIRASRVDGTSRLVEALARLDTPPPVLVCASAVGIYGSRGEELLTESSPPGEGFLPAVCLAWEQAAEEAARLGTRVVRLRTGMVVSRRGGALAKMLPAFRLGVAGRLGSGKQWMSWIHLDDVVSLIRFAVENTALSGPVNATAPAPVRNEDFTRELARLLRRPALIPVPEFSLKLLFGEMAEIVLASQRVVPAAAQSAGFRFAFPTLDVALSRELTEG